MDSTDMNAVVEKVVREYLRQDDGPLPIPVEVSARHAHLTREAVEALFGPGARLTKQRDLSQPGEFLSEQRVTLITPKGQINRVAVLGPEREAVQVELAPTDARKLGIAAPVNLSGDLTGAGDLCLLGEHGIHHAPGCAIVARAHVHMTPGDARRLSVYDRQTVRVRVEGPRPVVFEQVLIRVADHFSLALHIDTDEAGACCLEKGATALILPITSDAFRKEAASWPRPTGKP